MNKFFAIYLVAFCCAFFRAQQIPAGGIDLVDQDKISFLSLKKDGGNLTRKTENGKDIFIVSTITRQDLVYNLAVKIPVKELNLNIGQAVLLSFEAKTVQSSLETEEAKVNWVFRQNESLSPRDVIQKSASLSSEWKQYYLPFEITRPLTSEAGLSMQFGYPPQKFEIKNIRLIAFGKSVLLKDLPETKITYAGMEANAKWRSEAEKRIEQVRKGDFELNFTLKGQKVTAQKVDVTQQKHFFNFGAAIDAEDVLKNKKEYEIIKNLFNIIVFENDLKMKQWEKQKKNSQTLEAIKKLNEDGIKVKGHVLLWPGFHYLPNSSEMLSKVPQTLSAQLNSLTDDILAQTKNYIYEWDVINEANTNRDIEKSLGSKDIYYEMFKKSKKIQPNAYRLINEYGIISGGGLNKTKQDWYYNFAQEIDKNTGGLLDGIGFQSHIGNDLTPPEKVISILSRFSALHKRLGISEFTLDIPNDELKAQYTTDFMTAAFSMPDVKEFLFWGYLTSKNPKAGLVGENFKLTPMGQAYYDLVFKKWMTRLNQNTNNEGKISARGFYGTYGYTVEVNGKKYTGTFEVIPQKQNTFNIELK